MSTSTTVTEPADAAAAIAAVREQLVERGITVDGSMVRAVVQRLHPLLSPAAAEALVADVLAAVRGLGPLEPLLLDPSVTDVLVNGPRSVWIERGGRLERTSIEFATSAEVYRLIERAVSPLGLRIDPSSPYVDARLPDGSRLHASIPPIAVDGPYIAIRRFASTAFDLRDICTDAVASLLASAVRQRKTVVVTGATGAGKTTMLNALAREIAPSERIVTVEDTAELRLPKPHVVRLEARPANADGAGEVTMRDLVRNALRMRPDRIVVGECRGVEAFDMLQAINTGHRGSMTTCHANSAADAIARLEAMVLTAGVGWPSRAVRAQLARAIDLVVHLERDSTGQRAIAEISAVRDDGAVDAVVSARSEES